MAEVLTRERTGRRQIGAGIGIALVAFVVVRVVFAFQNADAVHAESEWGSREEIGTTFVAYLQVAPDQMAPRLSTVPGRLSFDDNMSPEQAKETIDGLLKCVYPDAKVSDDRILYLGYMVEDENDMHVLADYYRAKVLRGEPLDDVIPLPKPRADGRTAILRIQRMDDKPAGSAWSNWYRDPSIIPVFIERSYLSGRGGHIVFLDGHTMYYPFGRSNVWPGDRHTIGPLREMDDPTSDTN